MNKEFLRTEFELLAKSSDPKIYHSFCIVRGERPESVSAFEEQLIQHQRYTADRPIALVDAQMLYWDGSVDIGHKALWSSCFVDSTKPPTTEGAKYSLLRDFMRLASFASGLPGLLKLPVRPLFGGRITIRPAGIEDHGKPHDPLPWLEHLHMATPHHGPILLKQNTQGKLLELSATVLTWDLYRASIIALGGLKEDPVDLEPENGATTSRLFPNGPVEIDEEIRLLLYNLDYFKPTGKSRNDITKEYLKRRGSDPKTYDSLLAKIRRLRTDGLIPNI